MDRDLINKTLDGLTELNRIYRVDRSLSMAAAVGSFLLLLYITWRALGRDNADWRLLAGFFGGSGFLTYAMLRIAYFYNHGHKMLADALKHEMTRGAPE